MTDMPDTILIGTCRIKRMLAFMEDRQLKGRIKQISSHVHYAAEIKQVIEFIGGKDLPKDLLGLIIDDINVGKIGSLEELQEWRTETSKYLNNANKAIIEISSIKKYLLDEKRNIYGNITALNSILGSGTRLADFVPKETLQKRYQDLKPSLVSKEEIIARMGEIKKLLAGKQILWLSHFRFYIEEKGCEIEERLKLFEWISETAKEMGDDYFDQTIIVDTLGLQNALIDSSHYTQEAEKVMAKVISSWVVEGKIPDFGEKKKNSQRGSGTTAILKNQDGCIYNKDPQVTVFLLTVGSPQFKYTIKSITEQINKTDGFILKIIDHISPFSKACNMMIETCKTAYFIQLDEDMTLDDGALELMLDTMNQQVIKNPNVSQCVFRLRDKELGNILGVKIYNYEIVKNYYWENITSSDRIFNKKLKKDGYEIVIYGGKNDTVGTHAFYRTDFELFLKSATIGHKAKIQATSSDIKQFSMLYQKSLKKYSEENFYRICGICYGVMNNIIEDFNSYPKDTYTKLQQSWGKIGATLMKENYKKLELKVNKKLFLIFSTLYSFNKNISFPNRLKIYIERKQFFTSEDRVAGKYIIDNIAQNIEVYTIDSIFMQLPLFLLLGGYRANIVVTNTKIKNYIEYTRNTIEKDIGYSLPVIDYGSLNVYRPSSILIFTKKDFEAFSLNNALLLLYEKIFFTFLPDSKVIDFLKINKYAIVSQDNFYILIAKD